MKCIRQVRALLLFIRVVRDLYLYVVHELIPILHAADHLAYDKSARRNLDTMKKITRDYDRSTI